MIALQFGQLGTVTQGDQFVFETRFSFVDHVAARSSLLSIIDPQASRPQPLAIEHVAWFDVNRVGLVPGKQRPTVTAMKQLAMCVVLVVALTGCGSASSEEPGVNDPTTSTDTGEPTTSTDTGG